MFDVENERRPAAQPLVKPEDKRRRERLRNVLSLVLGLILIIAVVYGMTRLAGPRTPPPAAAETSTTPEPEAGKETPPTPRELAEEEARLDRLATIDQVRVLLCRETAERYMAARTGVQLARAIQISQANRCGWKYIMAEDAKTHGLTPEALEAAAEVEQGEVSSADGGAAGMAGDLDAMRRKLSNQESEISRLRYRSYYR